MSASTLVAQQPTELETTASNGSIYARLIKGSVWMVCASAVAQGAPVLAGIVIARLFGKEHFGLLGMVQSTAGMLGTVAGVGFGIAATKYVAELRSREPYRAGQIATLTAAMAALFGCAT